MKINKTTTAIATALGILIAYGFYSFWPSQDLHSSRHIIIVASTFFFSSITLVGSIGINMETSRLTQVIRTTSALFFIMGLLTILMLAIFTIGIPIFIIVIGVTTLLYLLIFYSLSKSKQ